MHTSSHVAASRRAAQQHQLWIAGGPPRGARLVLPSAAVTAVAGLACTGLGQVAAAWGLLALSALLISIAVSDRRSAWRFRPEPATPGRLQSPPVVQPAVIDLREQVALPAGPAPAVTVVRVPAQPLFRTTSPRPHVGQAARGLEPEAAAIPQPPAVPGPGA